MRCLIDAKRRYARHWLLEDATESEYNFVVSEAKLTDEQRQILEDTIKGDLQVKQSFTRHTDVSSIKRKIRKVYDKVYKVLCRHFEVTL